MMELKFKKKASVLAVLMLSCAGLPVSGYSQSQHFLQSKTEELAVVRPAVTKEEAEFLPRKTTSSVNPGIMYHIADDEASKILAHSQQLAAPEQLVKTYLARMAVAAKNYTPQIREAQTNHEAAEADVVQAEGARLPQITVGVQSNPEQFGSGQRLDKRDMTNGVNINATTPVFDWGYNSKNIQSKEFTAKASEAYYHAQFEDTSYQVCSELAELAKQRLLLQLSGAYVQRMSHLVNMIKDISDMDAGRVSELTQAQARLLQAQAGRDAAESKVHDAEIALRKLTGYTSYKNLPAQPAWNIHIDDPNSLLRAIGHHPTIIQAKNQALSALEQAKAVKAGNLPKLNWVVNKTIPINNGAYEESWQTYLNVSWGIYQGGSATAQEKAAALRAETAEEQIEEQKIDLSSKVRTAIHNTNTFLDQAAQYHNLVNATDRVRRDFFEQWRQLNTRQLLDVLTAESDYYNNQVNEVSSRFSAYSSMFTSYANAGMLNEWLGVNE
ncbi:TolC family protein [Rahnella ecdela]|uniref:TolC family protein n=1 Tax=Rahnella ecdela TaxID=2816250 RepID=A0ABS6LAE2_9GAMM|nr:TolC family protein [Rahnella ecdela]MBU9843621.1 TolC family protein [Rahnella ecdela]